MLLTDARVLVMGLTFQENTPDLRNTRVIDIVNELKDFGLSVDVSDTWADPAEARAEYGVDLVTEPQDGAYDAILLAVAHREYAKLTAAEIRALGKPNAVLYDLKGILPKADGDLRL